MKKTIYTEYQEAFRLRMAALREAAGLTQRQLASKLGRPHSMIAHIEAGQRRVDTVELFSLCKACHADPKRVASELMRTYELLDRGKKKSKAESSRIGRSK